MLRLSYEQIIKQHWQKVRSHNRVGTETAIKCEIQNWFEYEWRKHLIEKLVRLHQDVAFLEEAGEDREYLLGHEHIILIMLQIINDSANNITAYIVEHINARLVEALHAAHPDDHVNDTWVEVDVADNIYVGTLILWQELYQLIRMLDEPEW